MAGVNGWQSRQSSSDAMVGGAAAPSTNNTGAAVASPSSGSNFLQSLFSQTPQPAQPVATPQQIYGGGGEQNDATAKQIFGGGGEQNDATPQQIFGGGGEQNDRTPQQIFGGSQPSSTPEAQQPDIYAHAPSPASIASNSSQGTAGGSSGSTSTPSPAVQNATPAGLTPQAFSALLNNALTPNPLSSYYQWTYHFRLFMCKDGDIITQAGNPASVAALMSQLRSKSIPQVTIAETGVTGFNIRDVTIESTPAQNGVTFAQSALTFNMTITEPLGVSFLDGLFGAAATLGVFNLTQMTYYLELTFTGYNEQGQVAGRPIPFTFPNGGCWIWAINGQRIETKINEGGGVYTLTFTSASMLCGEDKKVTHGPQTMTIKGDTLGELFDNYTTEINKQWSQLYSANGKTLRTFKINTHPISAGPYAGDDIRTYSTKSQAPEQSSSRLFSLDGQGKVQAQIPAGMSTEEFIRNAIASTERGQKVIKDEPALGNTSQSSSQVNARKLREVTLFTVEIDPQQMDKEPQSGNYTYLYNVNVLSYYTQYPIVDATQIENARDATVQQQAITKLINLGMLRKRYDYIFTGKNTEVIDFNIEYNMAFNYKIAKLAGARLGYNNEAVNARVNQIQKQQSDTKPQAATSLTLNPQAFTAGNTQNDSSSSTSSSASQTDNGPNNIAPTPASVASTASHLASESAFQNSPASLTVAGSQNNPVAQATQAVLDGVQNPSAAVQNMLSGVVKASNVATSPVQASQPRLSNTSGSTQAEASSNLYIEDLLNSVNQSGSGNAISNPNLPISFWQGYQTPEWLAGRGMTGQWGRDQSVVGAIFSQIYECPIAKGFQSIDPLTIRGDPFWLGQTNLERAVKLRSGSGLFDPTAPPDYSTSKQVIYLYFKYPLQLGDDFTPKLTNSESFNGLYQIGRVKSIFSDGVFKQELRGQIMSLHDIDAAGTPTAAGGGGAGSSQQLAGAGGGGNSAPGAAASTQSTPLTANVIAAHDQLIAQGYTEVQAAGILGYLRGESGPNLDINAFNPAGGGQGAQGIAQWRGDRITGFENDNSGQAPRGASLTSQVSYIQTELNTTESATGAALANAPDAYSAGATVLTMYGRPLPSDVPQLAAERGAFAQSYFQQFQARGTQ